MMFEIQDLLHPRGVLKLLDPLGVLAQHGDPPGGLLALEVLREQGDQNVARSLTSNLGMLLVERGDEESVSVLTKLVDEYEALHMAMSAAAARANLSLYYLDRNEREAFERVERRRLAHKGRQLAQVGRSEVEDARDRGRRHLPLPAAGARAALGARRRHRRRREQQARVELVT